MSTKNDWEKVEAGHYKHKNAPAEINRVIRGWRLSHVGDPNHNQIFSSMKEAVAGFNPVMREVVNYMTGKTVLEPDDTSYTTSVASETYWSS